VNTGAKINAGGGIVAFNPFINDNRNKKIWNIES
jgi:hypothetical protein